ncbi:unnamed protein product, partial [Iphiclides podalirius]
MLNAPQCASALTRVAPRGTIMRQSSQCAFALTRVAPRGTKMQESSQCAFALTRVAQRGKRQRALSRATSVHRRASHSAPCDTAPQAIGHLDSVRDSLSGPVERESVVTPQPNSE